MLNYQVINAVSSLRFRTPTLGIVPGYNHRYSASAFKVELLPDQALTQFPQTISGSWVVGMSEGLGDLAVGEVQPLDFCV